MLSMFVHVYSYLAKLKLLDTRMEHSPKMCVFFFHQPQKSYTNKRIVNTHYALQEMIIVWVTFPVKIPQMFVFCLITK